MKPNLLVALFAAAVLVLSGGCTGYSTYHWGNYENQIYSLYKSPEKATPERQIASMRRDMDKALSRSKPLPPGFYAHLGVLYAQLGRTDEARRAFGAEKAAFPESSTLMEHFINQLDSPDL